MILSEQYVPAGPLVKKSKMGYRATQKLRGAVTGAGATAYHFATYTNILFYSFLSEGPSLEDRARAYAEATGGEYRPETRGNGVVYHVVRLTW